MPWLAQSSVESFWDDVVDALQSARFIWTVVVVVTAIVLWLLIRYQGRRVVAQMAKVRYRGADEITRAEGEQRLNTLWVVSRRLLAIVLFSVTFLTLLAVWGVPIAPLLALGGVVGIAIGLGAQDLIGDVISGFFILAEDQYSVGDVVEIAGVSGTVEDIQPRVTVLRDLEGRVHFIQNGQIKVSTNYTKGYAQVMLDIGISYGSDVDRALEIVEHEARAMHEDEQWASRFTDDPTLLGVNELGDWAVKIRILLPTAPEERWAVKREYLRRVKLRLDAEGIEIPFPYRTLVPGDVSRWRAALGGGDGSVS